MSKIKDLAAAVGTAGVLGAAGYGDLQMNKREAKEKADEKIEDMKRKEEPSGGDTPSTGRAKAMKKGGAVKCKIDGIAVRGKTRAK